MTGNGDIDIRLRFFAAPVTTQALLATLDYRPASSTVFAGDTNAIRLTLEYFDPGNSLPRAEPLLSYTVTAEIPLYRYCG